MPDLKKTDNAAINKYYIAILYIYWLYSRIYLFIYLFGEMFRATSIQYPLPLIPLYLVTYQYFILSTLTFNKIYSA